MFCASANIQKDLAHFNDAIVAGPAASSADNDVVIQPTAVRCANHAEDLHSTNDVKPNKLRTATARTSTRKRPAKPPPQDPAVTMQIITDQAAFATEIMQRERALAGKQSSPPASSIPVHNHSAAIQHAKTCALCSSCTVPQPNRPPMIPHKQNTSIATTN